MPSSVIIADVAGGNLNSSAANFKTAVKGAFSGTLRTLNGSFGSEVKMILKVTLELAAILGRKEVYPSCRDWIFREALLTLKLKSLILPNV